MASAERSGSLSVPSVIALLEQGVQDGIHYGAQLSIFYNGRIADFAVGEAAPGVSMTTEHVLKWSSAIKPFMSVALGILYERGLLTFDDTIAKHLPEFACQGKDCITISHCLTHTAGLWGSIRGLKSGWLPDAQVSHICQQPVMKDWVPGKRCAYDGPAWYILAAVVQAADPGKRSYEQFVEEEVCRPLNLSSSSVGMSAERYESLLAKELLAPIYLPPKATQKHDWRIIPREEEPEQIRYACPAGNGRGPAKELARFYVSLLPCIGTLPALISEDTVELITRVSREGLVDELQGTDTAWSLGFAVRSLLSGRHASSRAFGHGGSQSAFAFADPLHNLAVACLCNGKPGGALHYRRVGGISTALYEDLGLATQEGEKRTFQLPLGAGTF